MSYRNVKPVSLPGQFSDAEKAAYWKSRALQTTTPTPTPFAKRRGGSRRFVSAVPYRKATAAPARKKSYYTKASVNPRSNRGGDSLAPRGRITPRIGDHSYKKGAIRTAQNSRQPRMESISHLVESQGFDKSKFSSDLDNRLKKRSLYYQSLLDPMQGAGAKIPDLTAVPTGTFQLVQRVVGTTNAQGINAIRIPSPQFASANVTVLDRQFAGFQQHAGGSTGAALTWGAVQDWAGFTAFNSSVAYSRCVSAALYAEFLGTDLQTAGEFVLQFAPDTFASPTSVNQLMSFPYSSVVPTNRNTPCMVRYLPSGFYDIPFIQGGAGVTSDYESQCAS